MVTATRAAHPRDQQGRWLITPEAREALEAAAARLVVRVGEHDGYTAGRLDGEPDAPTFMPNVLGQQLFQQLKNIRAFLEDAVVATDPDRLVVGRRVRLRADDGSVAEYELVIPGEGDMRAGLVSADSPVGAAMHGRRVGDTISVAAPQGTWTATLVWIG